MKQSYLDFARPCLAERAGPRGGCALDGLALVFPTAFALLARGTPGGGAA
jgi:hypothetical protein